MRMALLNSIQEQLPWQQNAKLYDLCCINDIYPKAHDAVGESSR